MLGIERETSGGIGRWPSLFPEATRVSGVCVQSYNLTTDGSVRPGMSNADEARVKGSCARNSTHQWNHSPEGIVQPGVNARLSLKGTRFRSPLVHAVTVMSG